MEVQIEKAFDVHPATLRATFNHVEADAYAGWLNGLLSQLPKLLGSLAAEDRRERLEHLARASCPQFRLIELHGDAKVNGKSFVAQFFREVPVFNKQEVRERVKDPDVLSWSELMNVRYGDDTYYIADQFELDGTVNPLFPHIVKSFQASPHHTEWAAALWWISRTGWLDNASPRDIYRDDPEELKHALEQEILHYVY